MTTPSPPLSPLDRLRDIGAARFELDDRERRLIDEARAQGATWAQIAASLGLASRQAAEQRWMRLGGTATRDVAHLREIQRRQRHVDSTYGDAIAELRAAVIGLHRCLASDRRWRDVVPTADLIQATLEMAVDAPPGALFTLTERLMDDLGRVDLGSVPTPIRDAADTLRAAARRARPGTAA